MPDQLVVSSLQTMMTSTPLSAATTEEYTMALEDAGVAGTSEVDDDQ